MSTVAPLRLRPDDGRPESALRADWWNGPAIVVGVITSVLLPAAFFALAAAAGVLSWLIALLLALLLDIDPTVASEQAARESILEEEDVIEARFVQLGRDFEHELPNREVAVLVAAPPAPAEVPREDTPPLEQQTARERRPPDAVDAPMEQLLRRAGLFAELTTPLEREGNPEGIEEGTEREGSEGDLYRGRIMSFFRRGWTIPTTLSRDEVRGLTTVMNVEIGAELQIVRFEVRTSSGNPVFDESAVQQLTRLQASDQRIPPPPEEVADQYIGRTIAVRFNGRDAR